MNPGEYRVPDDFYRMRHVPVNTRTSAHADRVNKMGEWDADHRPSRTPMRILDHGRSLVFRLDVLNEGTMEMTVDSDPATGKLLYKGMKLCLTK